MHNVTDLYTIGPW